jgi:hypothetical protein
MTRTAGLSFLMSFERFKLETWAAMLVSSKDVAAVEGLLGFEIELTPLLELLRLFKLAVSEVHGSGGSSGGGAVSVSASTGLLSSIV